MKKIIKTLLVVMVLAVVLTAFTGCDAVETLKGIIPSELAAMIPPQLTCSVLGHKGAEHTPCERCGEVWMESNVSLECVLNGHKMVSVTQILPTCTEDGMTSGLVCSVCGHEDAPRKVLPATGHKMIPATCEVAEYCIYCRITGAEALGHTPVDVPAVAPTCSSVGHTAGTQCSVCKKILSGCEEIAIDPDAHYFVSGLCAICQKVFEYGVGDNTRVALDTLGVAQDGSLFEFVYFAVTEAGHYKISGQNIITSIFTLDASGNTVFVNPLVDLNNPLTWGEAYLEPGYYVLGLNYYAGAGEYTFNIARVDCTNTEEVTKAPTCTETGLKTTTCTVCGHVVEGVEVPATGHTNGTPVEENRVEATCSANGSYDSVVYCTVCETEVSREANVIPAAGHKDENGDFKCDACSTKMLPADGSTLTIEQALAIAKMQAHDTYTTQKYYITGTIKNVYNTQYGNMYIVDEEGNELCVYGLYSADGKTRYDAMSYKPVAGDEVTVYTVLGMFNTTAQGKNAWLDDVVAHEHDYNSVVTDPTCFEDGYTTHTCKLCGYVLKDTIVDALGHTTENGTCERCNQVIGGQGPVLVEKAYSYTFTSTQFTANGTKTLNGMKWTLAGNGGYWGLDNNGKGQQFGSSSKPYKSMTFTSEELTHVKKIVINTSGASSINGTLKVYVGNTLVKTITLTKTATTYTIDVSDLDGAVKFEYAQTSSKALYIKSIAIDYAVE